MVPPRVYVDFQNADAQGRVRLNCAGAMQDLARQQVELRDGLQLKLYSDDADDLCRPDDLEVNGVVEYLSDEQCWVARIDWSEIQHASAGLVTKNGATRKGTERTQDSAN